MCAERALQRIVGSFPQPNDARAVGRGELFVVVTKRDAADRIGVTFERGGDFCIGHIPPFDGLVGITPPALGDPTGSESENRTPHASPEKFALVRQRLSRSLWRSDGVTRTPGPLLAPGLLDGVGYLLDLGLQALALFPPSGAAVSSLLGASVLAPHRLLPERAIDSKNSSL